MPITRESQTTLDAVAGGISRDGGNVSTWEGELANRNELYWALPACPQRQKSLDAALSNHLSPHIHVKMDSTTQICGPNRPTLLQHSNLRVGTVFSDSNFRERI